MSKTRKSSKESSFKTVDTTKTKTKTNKKSKIISAASKTKKIQVKQYFHKKDKRTNHPTIGLVTPKSDKNLPPKKYSFDPYFSPQLNWSGKKENSEFEVDTISLHTHEKIDPMTVIEKLLKKSDINEPTISSFFENEENILPSSQEIEFYQHDQSWSNSFIAGDSLLVMNSLIHKENLGERIQMIYIDPPYGIKYGSNFQPFVNKRTVKDKKADEIERDIRTFRTGDKFKIGSLEVEPIHVDHSVPGAYGFIIHTSEGAVAYTGDIRLHGIRPDMTKDFVKAATDSKPIAFICEGTRITDLETDESEQKVYNDCTSHVKIIQV